MIDNYTKFLEEVIRHQAKMISLLLKEIKKLRGDT